MSRLYAELYSIYLLRKIAEHWGGRDWQGEEGRCLHKSAARIKGSCWHQQSVDHQQAFLSTTQIDAMFRIKGDKCVMFGNGR